MQRKANSLSVQECKIITLIFFHPEAHAAIRFFQLKESDFATTGQIYPCPTLLWLVLVVAGQDLET